MFTYFVGVCALRAVLGDKIPLNVRSFRATVNSNRDLRRKWRVEWSTSNDKTNLKFNWVRWMHSLWRIWVFVRARCGELWCARRFAFYHLILHKISNFVFRVTFVWYAKKRKNHRTDLPSASLHLNRKVSGELTSPQKPNLWIDKRMEFAKSPMKSA